MHNIETINGTVSPAIKEPCPDDADMEIEDLPGDLPLIAEITGKEKALEYAVKYGGVTIYLLRWHDDPEKWNDDIHDMVEVFGLEHAKEIVSFLAPGSITIPNCKKLCIQKKHREVIAARASGMPVKVVARKYRMHERMVRRITQAVRQEAEQNQMALL